MTEIPSALSAVTSQPGGRTPRRRVRHNIPGRKGQTLPPVHEGEIVFRLFPDPETLRVWGRKYNFNVKDTGRIPKKVSDHFNKWNAWSVYIVAVQPPGAEKPGAYFRLMQGRYERKLTLDEKVIEREIGKDLYPFLRRVKTP